MSRQEGDVLERNVRALLRRAYVPARPADEFRDALREKFLRRAEANASAPVPSALAPRRGWPLLLAGGLAAAGVAFVAWWVRPADTHGPGGLPAIGLPAIAGAPEGSEGLRTPPGAARELEIADPERRAAQVEPSESGGPSVEAESTPPGSGGAAGAATCAVRVRALDAETGAPIPAFTLWSRLETELPRVEFARPAPGRGGVVSAAGLDAGAHVLLVEAEGYAAWRSEGLALVPGDVTELEARLERGVSVRGEVRDPSQGVPVAGALVVAELDGPQGALPLDPSSIEPPLAHAITDAAGRYTIPHLSRRVQRLRVLHADYAAAWTSELVPPAIDAPSEGPLVAPTVDLSPGGSLEVLAQREGGAPAAGAEVLASLISMDRALPVLAYLRASTDAEGRFVAEHLPPGFYVVSMRDASGIAQLRQTTIEEDARARLRFGPGDGSPSLRGVLVGPDGAPRPGYQVAVVPEGPGAGDFEDWVVTATDDEGRFVFETLDPGRYGIYADRSATGMTRRDSVEIRAGGEHEVRVVLQGGTLAGRIALEDADRKLQAMLILVRAATEEPAGATGVPAGATGVAAGATGAPDSWSFHAKGDPLPDGTYRFDSLPPGRYRVALVGLGPDCGGYLSGPVELLSDETVDLPLTARAGVQVRPEVRTPAGDPISGVLVTFFDSTGDEFPYHPAPLTDARGRSPVPSLRAGRWTVEASAPGHATVRRVLDLDPAGGGGAVLELPLELEPR